MAKLVWLVLVLLAVIVPARADGDACVAVGAWVDPADGVPVAPEAVLGRASQNAVVLLGEVHDNPDHHRWQLQTMAALHARVENMALGFEMFPRRVQPVLDRWVAGDFDEAGFLEAVGWNQVWGFDAGLYMPLFHFARMNRLPMVALNVERALIDAVGEAGWDAVPHEEREGVGDPAAPEQAYVDNLIEVYREHQAMRGHHMTDEAEDLGDPAEIDIDDPGFQRFMDAQLTWDRAMAEALAGVGDKILVIGVIGGGHLEGGHGVPHQLAALGIVQSAVLLPWDQGRDCSQLAPGLADAVFGVAASPVAVSRDKPRLGVMIQGEAGDLTVLEVSPDSIAQATGIMAGDIIVEAAGLTMAEPADLIAVIQRQAPGTWLPLVIERDGEEMGLVARFPPEPEAAP
jgi:uncharacterized iron-regulated protein